MPDRNLHRVKETVSRIPPAHLALFVLSKMSKAEDKMKEREAHKQKQKQKLLATPGFNDLETISHLAVVPNISGAFGRSHPLSVDASEAGGKFLPCRTTLYAPSSSSVPKVSNAAPSSNLVMEHVYGYRGNDARDNAR